MKKAICSAGSNYSLIYPNGDVYRCMRYYNIRNAPIGNIQDANFKFFDCNVSCGEKICNSWCDSDWASKWLLNDKEIVDLHIPANQWADVLDARTDWKDRNIDDEGSNVQMVIWTPTLPCNYNCTYCGCAPSKDKVLDSFPSASPELSTEQWLSFFTKFKGKYEWSHIQTHGGEPFLHPATIPVFELLSDKFNINVVTNGSKRVMELTRSKVKPYDKTSDTGLQVTVSLHPSSSSFSWDQFVGNVLLLKNSGLLRGVNYVGWPQQLFAFDYYKRVLDDLGVGVYLQPWVGPDNNGFVGYSEAESAYVNLNTDKSRSLDNQLDLSSYVTKQDFASCVSLCDESWVTSNTNSKIINLRISNLGSESWSANSNIKVGIKILPSLSQKNALLEFRGCLQNDTPPASDFEYTIEINLSGIMPGKYIMVIDMVNEGQYWFGDRGFDHVTRPIEIH